MKRLSFLGVLIFCLVMAIPAFAGGAEIDYSGYSNQGQYFYSNVPSPTTYQYQGQTQNMEGGVISGRQTVPLVNINSQQDGLMMSQVGQNGEVELSTGNDANYGIHLDANGVTVGTSTDASAVAVTAGDAVGYSGADSNINVNININI